MLASLKTLNSIQPDRAWYWLHQYPVHCEDCDNLLVIAHPSEWIVSTPALLKSQVFLCDSMVGRLVKEIDLYTSVDRVELDFNGLITKQSLSLCIITDNKRI